MLTIFDKKPSGYVLAEQILKQHNIQVLFAAGAKTRCLTAGISSAADDFDIAQFHRAVQLIARNGYQVCIKEMKSTGSLITKISVS